MAKRAAVRDALTAAASESEARKAIAHLSKPELIRIYRERGGNPSQNIDEAVLRRAIVARALEGKTPAQPIEVAPVTQAVWVDARGGIVRNPSQVEIVRGQVTRREIPGPADTGPGVVPIGGTDADRRGARPRIEGESDRAYAIRTAPSRDAALRQLQGHQLAGLRAIARAEGVVTVSSDTKAGLIERLMRALYDRHADSIAITNMVNRDRVPAPAKAVPVPRTNTPSTGGPITPTMTGAQLIAARRKLQAEQQGGDRR